jgi:phenylacetyl-CoA:acceptor oxidoreductase 26-kDa subunit
VTFAMRSALQKAWDARAAANFICGGAGSGLIVFTVAGDARGFALQALLAAGLALVGCGLLCVWHELGHPRRALNVFLHPRTSWMSREAIAATLLVPVTLAAMVGVPGMAMLAAIVAAAFAVCQARMLQAARAIPAWREPLSAPLLVVTAFVEGGGLFFAVSPWLRVGDERLLVFYGSFVLVRVVVFLVYRRAIANAVPAAGLAALDRAGSVLNVATIGALVAIAAIVTGFVGEAGTFVLAAIAGVASLAGGVYLKQALVLRAAFRQAHALSHLPVRGRR